MVSELMYVNLLLFKKLLKLKSRVPKLYLTPFKVNL